VQYKNTTGWAPASFLQITSSDAKASSMRIKQEAPPSINRQSIRDLFANTAGLVIPTTPVPSNERITQEQSTPIKEIQPAIEIPPKEIPATNEVLATKEILATNEVPPTKEVQSPSNEITARSPTAESGRKIPVLRPASRPFNPTSPPPRPTSVKPKHDMRPYSVMITKTPKKVIDPRRASTIYAVLALTEEIQEAVVDVSNEE